MQRGEEVEASQGRYRGKVRRKSLRLPCVKQRHCKRSYGVENCYLVTLADLC